MIPKTIHYCWFGGGRKNSKTERLLNTFQFLKSYGYEIIEWNENNYDVNNNEFLRRAYRNKKWAHVSDYARLDILHEFGGIYLDTDVEVVKVFDDLLNYDLFMGFMWDCNLGTAVIGASKGNRVIKDIRDGYLVGEISLNSPNNDIFTRYFLKEFNGFKLNGESQTLYNNSICIKNKNNFEHPSFLKKTNYTIHHFSQSWKKSSKFKFIIKKIIISTMGLYLYRRYICAKSLKLSPFYKEYIRQK